VACFETADSLVENAEFDGDFVDVAAECLQTPPGDLGWTVGEHVACLRSRGVVTELMTSGTQLDDPLEQIVAAKPWLMKLAKEVSLREWRRYQNRQVWLGDEEAGRDFRRGVFLGFLYTISDTASRSLCGKPLQSAISSFKTDG